MGRQARGVNGIRLRKDDAVIGMEVISDTEKSLLTVAEFGFGKRTSLNEYPVHKRGGLGVITIKSTPRVGDVVRIQMVDESDHLLILTSGGRIIRLMMEQISVIGRNTQGYRLLRLEEEPSFAWTRASGSWMLPVPSPRKMTTNP